MKPNKKVWDVGDIVIHEDDEKIELMLMKVIDVFDDGLAKTVYVNPKGNVEFFQFNMSRLHDPLELGITGTLSFPQELEWRIENLNTSILSPNADVDMIRYLKGQRSTFRYALEIYRDCQKQNVYGRVEMDQRVIAKGRL